MFEKKVIIIGGGLVGSLCACFMAERNYDVTVYEKREDMRKVNTAQGRSINLALSHRGRAALRQVHLEDTILEAAIPMKGRFLHSVTGSTKSVPYDPLSNECIYSVGRNYLNKTLLEAAEKYSNVKLYFNHKLIRSNIRDGTVTILNTETYQSSEDKADLIIGADGAYSALRRSIQQYPQFDYSQNYIEHGYMELCIPAERNKQMVPNHLHIWPRGEFMMIALPNQDGSWTVTLFMPFRRFDELTDGGKVVDFFSRTFPDAVDLIGEKQLIETFDRTRPSSLVSIKCRPHDFGSRVVIIGDAAHVMVPFYGQGMNAGFEDCLVLNNLLDKHFGNIEKAVKEYSKIRVDNVHAICELAMYNYVEMRDLVTKPSYHLRKYLDNVLQKFFPKKWVPLYNSVSFSHMDYRKCVQNRKWQDNVIQKMLISGVVFFIFTLCLVATFI